MHANLHFLANIPKLAWVPKIYFVMNIRQFISKSNNNFELDEQQLNYSFSTTGLSYSLIRYPLLENYVRSIFIIFLRINHATLLL